MIEDDPFPRHQLGYRSPWPWNADWGGACERCGHRFAVESELSLPPSGDTPPGWGVRRRVLFRPGSIYQFQGLDLQLGLAGIEIIVDTESYGRERQTERLFLSKEEAARLTRALDGPLAICFEQFHWDFDVT
jgi:hypothetical protein